MRARGREGQHEAVLSDATPSRQSANPAADSSARRTYSPPRLVSIGDLEDLLEVLGPAQANYGGPPGG